MTPEVQSILDIIQQVGMWAVFAWLYMTEKRDHAETRKSKDLEIERLRSAHMADMRELAGLQRSLYRVGSADNPAVPRDRNEFNHQPPPVLPSVP